MPGLIEQEDNTHIGLFNSIEVPRLLMAQGAEIGNYNTIKGNCKGGPGQERRHISYCSIMKPPPGPPTA